MLRSQQNILFRAQSVLLFHEPSRFESESILLPTNLAIGFGIIDGNFTRPTQQTMSLRSAGSGLRWGCVGRASFMWGLVDCFFALARSQGLAAKLGIWNDNVATFDHAHKVAQVVRLNSKKVYAVQELPFAFELGHPLRCCYRCTCPAIHHLLHRGVARVTSRHSWRHGRRPSPTGRSRRPLPISFMAFVDHRAVGRGGTAGGTLLPNYAS
jgi:hypothetical protein